jgi:hypothetical protein
MSELLDDLSQNLSQDIPTPVPTPAPTPIASEEKKKPFAEGPVPLSGMTASVLNPKSDAERERIEKEIEKRKKQLDTGNKGPALYQQSWFKAALIVVLVVLIAMPAMKYLHTAQMVSAKMIKKISFFKPRQPKVLKENKIVFERNFRLVMTTNQAVDKVTVIVLTKNKPVKKLDGKLLAKDKDRNIMWEFQALGLKKGKYTYKYFAKNMKSAKVVAGTGAFDVK